MSRDQFDQSMLYVFLLSGIYNTALTSSLFSIGDVHVWLWGYREWKIIHFNRMKIMQERLAHIAMKIKNKMHKFGINIFEKRMQI